VHGVKVKGVHKVLSPREVEHQLHKLSTIAAGGAPPEGFRDNLEWAKEKMKQLKLDKVN